MKSINTQNRWLLLSILFLVFPFFPSNVMAKEGGIAIGAKGRFQPRLFIGSAYDNNVFRTSSTNESITSGLAPRASFYLKFRPGLRLTLPSSVVDFDLSSYFDYSYYFEQLAAKLNVATAKADLFLHFLKNSAFSFTISDNFSRGAESTLTSQDVFNGVLAPAQLGTPIGGSFISHSNKSRLALIFQPGRKAFRIDLGYAFKFIMNPLPETDSNEHDIDFSVKWTFFPKTALLLMVDTQIVHYNPRLDFSKKSFISQDLIPFRAKIGIVGNFTERTSLSILLGGGSTFVQANKSIPSAIFDNYSMVIGAIDLKYFFTSTSYFRIGLDHDFSPSLFANFRHHTTLAIEFSTLFARSFLLSLKGTASYIGYGIVATSRTISNSATGRQETYQFAGGTPAKDDNNKSGIKRSDVYTRAILKFDWRALPWFIVGLHAGIDYLYSDTKFRYNDSGKFIDFGYFAFHGGLKIELVP